MKRCYKVCEKCNYSFSLPNFKKHADKCNGVPNYWTQRRQGIIDVDNSVICKFCNKECKNANSCRNHSRLCKLNPNKQITHLTANQESIINDKKQNKIYSNKFVKAKALGLPKPIISEETRLKLSLAMKSRSKEIRQKSGEKISNTVANKLLEGTWHTYGSNSKKSIYKGIMFDSSWEVKYAKWLDSKQVTWERCKEKFSYIFNNYKKNYIPDFFLPNTNEYIEIKGLKTERDVAKWEHFPKNKKLVILMREDLINLGIEIT